MLSCCEKSVNFPVYIQCGINVVTLASEEYLCHMEQFLFRVNYPKKTKRNHVYVCTEVEVADIQGGSNMTGTDLYVNEPHCAAAVRP